MRLAFFCIAILASEQAIAQDEPKLGCIFVDHEEVEPPLEPWDAWQSWCDLSQDVESVQCFDFDPIDEQWVATVAFDPKHLLERVEAGSGTCPVLPDTPPPDFRG